MLAAFLRVKCFACQPLSFFFRPCITSISHRAFSLLMSRHWNILIEHTSTSRQIEAPQSLSMALKRKRSSPTFSSPVSDTSNSDSALTSSPGALPFFYAQSKPTEPLYHKPSWSFPTYQEDNSHNVVSRHLNSRTRKRHRDNRPDEERIYGVSCWLGAVLDMSTLADVCRCAASTISRLYEAQRQQPRAEPVPSQPMTNATILKTDAPVQRSTLHSFWSIGAQPPERTLVPMAIDTGPNLVENAIRCEDCHASLWHEDAMELDDGVVEQETACHICRRRICDGCAVLGNERICLPCASRGR